MNNTDPDMWAWLPAPRDAPAERTDLDDPLTAWLEARNRPRRAPRKAAQKAAIERRLAAYVRLSCGHTTTREEQEAMSVWRPHPGALYCGHWPDSCGWVTEAPPPVREPLPDEPPY